VAVRELEDLCRLGHRRMITDSRGAPCRARGASDILASMPGEAIEDEAMVLAAGVFSGREARGLLGCLVEERELRCRARLAELTRGDTAGRRRKV